MPARAQMDPAVLQGLVDRLRRERPAPGLVDVEAAGLVHGLTRADVGAALRTRVFDLDVAATLRGGERADDIRAELPAMGFRL